MQTYAGGCQCEYVRYELTGERHIAFACHCHLCQKQSGSAFGMGAKPGTLDDTSWLKPDYHSWLSSAQGWEAFHPDETLFEEQSGRL